MQRQRKLRQLLPELLIDAGQRTKTLFLCPLCLCGERKSIYHRDTEDSREGQLAVELLA